MPFSHSVRSLIRAELRAKQEVDVCKTQKPPYAVGADITGYCMEPRTRPEREDHGINYQSSPECQPVSIAYHPDHQDRGPGSGKESRVSSAAANTERRAMYLWYLERPQGTLGAIDRCCIDVKGECNISPIPIHSSMAKIKKYAYQKNEKYVE